MNRFLDLAIVALMSVTALVLVLTEAPHTLLHPLVMVPLVLFLPGYTLMRAVVPDALSGLAERAMMSIGVSLSIAVLGGLTMHFAGLPIEARTWSILLSGVTLSLAGVALVRRMRPYPTTTAHARLQVKPLQVTLLGVAACLLAGSYVISATGALQQPAGFTQLWALPEPNQPSAIHFGVTSYELEPESYRVALVVDGKLAQEWPEIRLAPGSSWEASTTLPGRQLNTNPVAVELYRTHTPAETYRRVILWPDSQQ